MDLTQLLHDDRPFALLRRRTPGHDENTVELLVGPVGTCDRLADLPDEGTALIPFRQIRERGFDVRDDGTPLAVLTPEETHALSSRRPSRSFPPTTSASRTAASTWPTRSTPRSSDGCCTRRSGAARAPTS